MVRGARRGMAAAAAAAGLRCCCPCGAVVAASGEVNLYVVDDAGTVKTKFSIDISSHAAPQVAQDACSKYRLSSEACTQLQGLVQQALHQQAAETYKGAFTPEAVWHVQQTALFDVTLRHLRDTPVRILEVGSYEGLSATWFMLYFSSAATMTCVDTWADNNFDVEVDIDNFNIEFYSKNFNIEVASDNFNFEAASARWARFLANTAFARPRLTARVGRSSRALFGLDPKSYDIAYVDGSHEAPDALSDMVMAFRLLKPGGVMLVDDVLLFPGGWTPGREAARLDHVDAVYPAARAFLHVFGGRVRVLHEGYQLHVQRLL